jgi:hypothetical protein
MPLRTTSQDICSSVHTRSTVCVHRDKQHRNRVIFVSFVCASAVVLPPFSCPHAVATATQPEDSKTFLTDSQRASLCLSRVQRQIEQFRCCPLYVRPRSTCFWRRTNELVTCPGSTSRPTTGGRNATVALGSSTRKTSTLPQRSTAPSLSTRVGARALASVCEQTPSHKTSAVGLQ